MRALENLTFVYWQHFEESLLPAGVIVFFYSIVADAVVNMTETGWRRLRSSPFILTVRNVTGASWSGVFMREAGPCTEPTVRYSRLRC